MSERGFSVFRRVWVIGGLWWDRRNKTYSLTQDRRSIASKVQIPTSATRRSSPFRATAHRAEDEEGRKEAALPPRHSLAKPT